MGSRLLPAAKTRPRSSVPRAWIAVITLALLAAPCKAPWASEAGLSVYLLGSQGPLAGILPPPGTYFRNDLHYYEAELSAKVPEKDVEIEADLRVFSDHLRLTHVTDWTILGANWGFGLVQPIVYAEASADIRQSIFRQEFDDESNFAPGDLTLTPIILGWHAEPLHVLTAFSVYVPTGQNSPSEDVNIGRNYIALDPTFGFTWLSPKRGHEISAFLGYTVNFENEDSRYRSGNAFHADAVLAQHFDNGLSLGVGGYYYKQITGDSGEGATFGDFKGRVYAAGPHIAYRGLNVGEAAINLQARYLREFAAKNRFEGDRFFLTVSLAF